MQPLDVIVGLAGDPALELLNSRATPSPGSEPIELIGDGANYLRWLARTGLIDEEDRAVLEDLFSAGQLDGAAGDARTLREKLRPILLEWAGEKPVPFPVDVIDELNALLAQDRRYTQLNPDNDTLVLHERRHWEQPTQLLVLSAQAWAHLLAEGDPTLIRQCPGCTIIFYDRTKAHRRRWCSMALCGNRAKVRRHRTTASSETNQRT
jgi:predicted RNA-binding Zn ribbon-like protein